MAPVVAEWDLSRLRKTVDRTVNNRDRESAPEIRTIHR
jgi:hypothetical protein